MRDLSLIGLAASPPVSNSFWFRPVIAQLYQSNVLLICKRQAVRVVGYLRSKGDVMRDMLEKESGFTNNNSGASQ